MIKKKKILTFIVLAAKMVREYLGYVPMYIRNSVVNLMVTLIFLNVPNGSESIFPFLIKSGSGNLL